MKLAEALQERADLNRRIEQIKCRLNNNATVQEGETPAEDPQKLMTELDVCIATLQTVMTNINLTNSKTMLGDQSLTQLLAQKDCLILKLSAYRSLASEASQLVQRATRTEIKIVSTVDVKETQATVDAMAKQLRTLDNKIQQLNWETQLQE